MKLPPLPLQDLSRDNLYGYTNAQMHAYGEACARAMHAECVALLREMADKDTLSNYYAVAARRMEEEVKVKHD